MDVLRGWRRYACVQPPIMIILFAQSMSGTILTDLIVYRTCIITMSINKTECALLHTNNTCEEALKINTVVQPYASFIIMCKSFVETIVPAFLSLFLGPWSDKYGRRPLILAGCIGVLLTYLILTLMTNWDISPWFLLAAYIPSALSGGFCILMLASICYIADITQEHNRAWHLAWLEALICLGIMLGIFSGPIIFKQFGYTAVLSVSAMLCIVALIYVCFGVPETINNLDIMALNSLFDISLVKEMVQTCTKKRHGFDRCIVWCCITCLTILIINLQGEGTIGFLFASARLGWDVSEYSTYMITSLALSVIGTIVGVSILKRYSGFSDVAVAILAVLSSFAAAVTRAFTWKVWHMYLAVTLGMFGGVAGPTIRAILSKAVPSQDAGKVFSLTTSVETLTPFGAASLFSIVYSSYMPPIYPSPVWLVCAGFFGFTIVILMYIQVQISRSRSADFTPLISDVRNS